jgi:outer membrane protein with beta-barrel domain
MKKSLILTFALITIIVTGSYAQGFHLGVKGGANIVKVDGQSFDQEYKFGYLLGAFAELDFTKKWGVQPELLFSQTNYRTASNASTVIPETFNDVKGSLNYLSIPILITYRPVPLLSLQAGPQFGILLNHQNDLVENGKNAFKSGDFSVVGGAQLNFGGFKAGARYFIGLNNINDIDSNEKWKNQGFQIFIGFSII